MNEKTWFLWYLGVHLEFILVFFSRFISGWSTGSPWGSSHGDHRTQMGLSVFSFRLTAFVMKSFGGARPYIFVDLKHIEEARRWLSGLQKPDGCITSVGKLFHNGMKVWKSPDLMFTSCDFSKLKFCDIICFFF